VRDHFIYLPAAFLTDNKQGYDFRLRMQSAFQTTETVILTKKDEITVQIQGDNLFAGWSIPIPLFKPNYSVQPAYVKFSGHGCSQKYSSEIIGSLKRRIRYDYDSDSMAAFVTFIYPNQKYSGLASDGFLHKNLCMISCP
jgi:hypothetical protein